MKYKKYNNLEKVSKILNIKYHTLIHKINDTLLVASNSYISNCFYEEKEQQFYVVNDDLIVFIKKNKILYIIVENGGSYNYFNRIISDIKEW